VPLGPSKIEVSHSSQSFSLVGEWAIASHGRGTHPFMEQICGY
jgi:hypothetical protein